MPVRIYTTNAGTDLSDAEAALLADLVARHGRAVLLAPSFAELDLCRHDAAEAGVSLGVDYKTPTSWLRSLWELMGDGRSFVDTLQRQMLFSDLIDRRDDAALQPLSRSQGTVRMLARMARDVMPGVAGTGDERCRDAAAQPEPKSDAEARVFELLSAYAGGLDRRDMVAPCEAADMMAEALANNLPGCARAVCVRGVTSFTHGLLELLSAVANRGGEDVVLLACEQAALRELAEETGVVPVGEDGVIFDQVGAFYSSEGMSDELANIMVMHLRRWESRPRRFDPDEHVESAWVTWRQLAGVPVTASNSVIAIQHEKIQRILKKISIHSKTNIVC